MTVFEFWFSQVDYPKFLIGFTFLFGFIYALIKYRLTVDHTDFKERYRDHTRKIEYNYGDKFITTYSFKDFLNDYSQQPESFFPRSRKLMYKRDKDNEYYIIFSKSDFKKYVKWFAKYEKDKDRMRDAVTMKRSDENLRNIRGQVEPKKEEPPRRKYEYTDATITKEELDNVLFPKFNDNEADLKKLAVGTNGSNFDSPLDVQDFDWDNLNKQEPREQYISDTGIHESKFTINKDISPIQPAPQFIMCHTDQLDSHQIEGNLCYDLDEDKFLTYHNGQWIYVYSGNK